MHYTLTESISSVANILAMPRRAACTTGARMLLFIGINRESIFLSYIY